MHRPCERVRALSLLGSGLLLAALMPAPSMRAAETTEQPRRESLAEFFPKDTYILIEIPDFPEARKHYLAMPRAQLWWKGPGRPLLNAWCSDFFDTDLGAIVMVLNALPGGLAYAFLPHKIEDWTEPYPVIIADAPGGADPLVHLFVRAMGEEDLLDPEWIDEEMVDVEGGRFFETWPLVGSYGGRVIVTEEETATAVVKNLKAKPVDGLTSSSVFKLARSRAGANADFFALFNIAAGWGLFTEDLFDDEAAFLRATGLLDLKAICQAGRFTPQGAIDRFTFVLAEKPGPMWALLRPLPLSRNTWQVLPAFVSGFVSIRLDFARRVEPFLAMWQRAMPEEEYQDFIDFWRSFREQTSVSFDKDVLPLTTGEITFAFLEEPPGLKPTTEDGGNLAKLVLAVVELSDPDAAKQMMQRLELADWEGGGKLARKRRFGPLDGWVVGPEGEEFYVAGRAPFAFFAFEPEPLERVANALSAALPRLVDSAAFINAVRWLPRDTGFAAFSDMHKILRNTHKCLRHEIESTRDEAGVGEFPPLEPFLQNLSPLSAALQIHEPEEPGGPASFTFEVHSPHGFWAFYAQLIAHIIWRTEIEPEIEHNRLAQPAYEAAMQQYAELKTPQEKIEFLTGAMRQFAGTKYAVLIHQELMRQRQLLPQPLPAPHSVRPAAAGRVAGKVMNVSPEGPNQLVALSIGSDHGVAKGMLFGVYRDGARIADVEIIIVSATYSVGRIVRTVGGEKVRVQDDARLEAAAPAVVP